MKQQLVPGVLWITAAATLACAADLPVQEVILYKHGVAYFQRGGEIKAGEAARLDFKASEMNDVLKSLTVTDRGGNKISSIRYDASEPLEKRLEDFPFAVGDEASLAAFLDQMKGARIELKFGPETVAGTIISARLIKSSEKDKFAEKESLVLLTDSGDIRTLDLDSAASVRLPDPKLQAQLKDYLTVISGARSKDRRSVVIESSSTGARELTASYMTPSSVWKSSYRLIFGAQAEPMLEGWAIVDNTSGDDWNNVKLSRGFRPSHFIHYRTYDPRYVNARMPSWPRINAVAPVVFQGAMGALIGPGSAECRLQPPTPSPAAKAQRRTRGLRGSKWTSRERGFGDRPVRVAIADRLRPRPRRPLRVQLHRPRHREKRRVRHAPLPAAKHQLAKATRIYEESFGLHPMNAAEISNSTGKTLDGGPITVYDAGRVCRRSSGRNPARPATSASSATVSIWAHAYPPPGIPRTNWSAKSTCAAAW